MVAEARTSGQVTWAREGQIQQNQILKNLKEEIILIQLYITSARTVIAGLSLVAVVEVLLLFHCAESAVENQIEASSTSSVGHFCKGTRGTLFNTLA